MWKYNYIEISYFQNVNRMVKYTLSLTEDTFEKLNEMANRFQIHKNELINKALVNYLEVLDQQMFIASFREMVGDKEMVVLAEEGISDYLYQLSDFEKGNKTPSHEIEKAKRSMNKYFEQKKDKI